MKKFSKAPRIRFRRNTAEKRHSLGVLRAQRKFAARLRKNRKKRGVTSEQLAQTCRMSPGKMGQIERGEVNVSFFLNRSHSSFVDPLEPEPASQAKIQAQKFACHDSLNPLKAAPGCSTRLLRRA